MRTLCFALAISLAACARNEPVAEPVVKDLVEKTAAEPLKTYALKGEVTRLDAENKIATIKHEAIGDWMGPMTMDFPVKDLADFVKLSPGKSIQAKVFVEGLDYWVGSVE